MKRPSMSRWFGLITLLLLVGVLAGCGGSRVRNQDGSQAKMPLLLPRMTVSVDEQGVPTILGISTERAASLIGQDASALKLDPALIATLQAAGVQHIEAILTGQGVYLFVNGQPIPYLDLDEETRQSVGDLLKLFNVRNEVANAVQGLLNNDLISRVGVPLLIKLPTVAEATEIAPRDAGILPIVDTEQTRASTGAKVLIAHLDVALDADGQPTIAGSSMADLQAALLQAGLLVDLSTIKVDPATVSTLKAKGILLLQAETEPEGLYLHVNGRRLPRIAWDGERLKNALGLYRSLQPDSAYLPLAELLLPYLPPSDIELRVNLPLDAGQQAPAPASWVSP